MGEMTRSAQARPSVDAWLEAQKIALGPIIFQAARLLRDLGILGTLREHRSGLTMEEIVDKVVVPRYGVIVLIEAGLAAGVVRCDEERYFLTPTGFVVLTDASTRVNMNVVEECCFQPAYYLEESIREGKPVGLQKVFGDWETIYSALAHFPETARETWLAWDHFYSDSAFRQALPIVFEHAPRSLLDVGGNTGKWAIQCANHCRNISVTILDLPDIVALAEQNIREHGLEDRIGTAGVDLLDTSRPFPRGFDAIWMSQFLVCFSEEQATSLIERAADAMDSHTKLYILDNFWDRQTNDVAALCLQTFSLYFTFLANGCSRMYKATDITRMVEAAGMTVERVHDNLGICTSLMVCGKH
jgi:hypothetical protein